MSKLPLDQVAVYVAPGMPYHHGMVGRSRDADIQVTDPNVSRRHAEVREEGSEYWLVDLDSTNGIEVRGRRVKRVQLENGTRFTIGSTEIEFDREVR